MALKLELEADEGQDPGDLEREHKLNHSVKTDGKKNNKSLVVDYFEDNVEELNSAGETEEHNLTQMLTIILRVVLFIGLL